jgi:carbamoyltransferase
MALVRRLKRQVPFDNLCFAGGVALNCVANEQIKQSGVFSDVFIPYAAHDAGTAIGAAFAVHAAKAKNQPERGNATPYLGPEFERRDILAAVKAAGFTPQLSKNPARDAAEMLADGKIVAWFQGRMEFGPRALGNRSLLADPRRPDMRNILRRESNPRFHELISCFHERTGVPLVVNTSFNDSEPIVCTPADAIVTFRKSGIDALFMDNVYLTAED